MDVIWSYDVQSNFSTYDTLECAIYDVCRLRYQLYVSLD